MGSNHTLRPSEGGTVTRGSPANRDALRALLKPETTAWKYNHGIPDNDGGLAERVLARQFLNLPARRGQGATRPVRRLQEQRRALSDLPGVSRLAASDRNDPFFLPAGPRRSSATSRTRLCASSIPDISRRRRMPPRRPFAASFPE